MATKKSTKKNTRKRGRRYLKKAVRRTIAALLMVTALIVAAIPATPGRAEAPSEGYDIDNFFISQSGYACEFESYSCTDPDDSEKTITGCRLIGVYSTSTISGIDTPTDPGTSVLPNISFESGQTFGKDGSLGKCIAISNSIKNKSCIKYIECPDVIEIPNGAFQQCSNLNQVIFKSVRKINSDAFKECGNLTNANFSNKISEIGSYAFYKCSNLENFAWPDTSLTNIGSYAFYQTKLREINIPRSYPEGEDEPKVDGIINEYAFAEIATENMSDVVIGEGYTTIGNNAFEKSPIKNITLPSTLTTVQTDAFNKCEQLISVKLTNSQALANNKTIFSTCSGLKKLSIVNNTDSTDATLEISNQTYFPIPVNEGFYMEGYRYVEGTSTNTSAFDYCRHYGVPYRCLDSEKESIQSKFFTVSKTGELTDINVEGYFSDRNPFKPTESGTLEIPSSVTVTGYKDADKVTYDITSISKTAFDDSAESDLAQITKIVLFDPSETTDTTQKSLNIQDSAFSKLKNLKEAEFTIKDVSFAGTSVFPDGMKSTEANPLLIIVGNNLVNDSGPLDYAMRNDYLVRGYSVDGARSLYLKRYTDGAKTYTHTLYQIDNDTDETYSGDFSSGNLNLPSGVHYIMPKYLQTNTKLENFNSDGLEGIFGRQFYNCLGLKGVSLPNSLKTIGNEPFLGCNNLYPDKFSIADNAYTSISDGVIYAPDNGEDEEDNNDSSWNGVDTDYNKTLVQMLKTRSGESFTVPSDVKKIRPGAFKQTAINEFHILSNSAQVKRIPKEAFNESAVLKIYLGKTVTRVGNDAFKSLNHEASSELPKIYVYSDICGWNVENRETQLNYNSSSEEQPYYFICNDESITAEFCEKEGDNLIRLNLPLPAEDGSEIDLSEYSIFINSGSEIKSLKADGSAPDWIASSNSTSGDFFVYKLEEDGSQDIVPTDKYSVEFINEEDMTKPGATIKFSAKAIDGSGYIKSTSTASFQIEGGASDKLGSIGYIQQDFKYNNGEHYDITKYIQIKDTDGNLITNSDFYTITPLDSDINMTDVTGTKGGVKEIKFFVSGDGTHYTGTLTGGKVTITDDGSGSSSTVDPGKLTGAEILLYTSELPYTGQTIRLTPVKADTELNADGQFLVFGPDGTVLQYPTDYTFTTSPRTIKDEGTYTITINGKNNYEPGVITDTFTVKAQGLSSSSSSSSSASSSSSSGVSSLSVNLILNGPDRSAVSPETYKSTNNFQYWNEGDPGIKSIIDKQGNALSEGTDYTVQSYGSVRPGIGKNTGYVQIQFKGNYAGEGRQNFYYDVKKDLSKNTSDDGVKSVTIQVPEATIDQDDKIEATVKLTDSTTGTDLAKDTDYLQGGYIKTSGHHADVKVIGKGDKYVGTYTYNFRMNEKKSSSSSGKSSSSSSKGGSSSARSSSSSGGPGGSGSSSSGGGGGGGNTNSGTTVVNRNYYNSGNGGTADELQDMLKAAHIDSINGGTADGYQVNITKSDASEAAFREALLRRYGSLDNIRYFSMDIDVKDENGNDIDTSGMSVTLTLPLPESMEAYGTNNKVATVDGNGDLEDLNVQFSTLEGRPCATFVAPHFSPYGFYVNTGDLAIGTLDNTPKTGDPISPKWFISLGLAALSIFLFLKKDPKPRAKAA